MTVALTVELLFFALYAVGWWVTGGAPRPGLGLALLLSTAVALGIQSSTVQRFGVSGMSTTYLTGTLTTVVIRLASGRGVREVWHSIEILLGLVAGAAAGAALVLLAPMFAPALQLVALGGVVLVGPRSRGRSDPHRSPLRRPARPGAARTGRATAARACPSRPAGRRR